MSERASWIDGLTARLDGYSIQERTSEWNMVHQVSNLLRSKVVRAPGGLENGTLVVLEWRVLELVQNATERKAVDRCRSGHDHGRGGSGRRCDDGTATVSATNHRDGRGTSGRGRRRRAGSRGRDGVRGHLRLVVMVMVAVRVARHDGHGSRRRRRCIVRWLSRRRVVACQEQVSVSD